MKSDIDSQSQAVIKKSRLSGFYQKLLFRQLSQLRQGQLTVVIDDQQFSFGAEPSDLNIRLWVISPNFFESVIQGGSVGAAESYMAGDWYCDNLTALVQLLVRNRHLSDGLEKGPARIAGWFMKALHWFNRNTRDGSRRNIAAHYDLGNQLFELFLDKDWMMYSSGLFISGAESLEESQALKLSRLCDKLSLTADDHLLEIGTGWGGAAMFAALNYGCRVTTTTISRQQYEYTQLRVARAGLQDRVTVLLEDYRDLQGQYDKLISIEMVEAVGHHFIESYFQKCADLLKPDGLAVIQAITIEDHRYAQAVKEVDFIKRYIFPGSFIPSVTVLANAAARAELRLTSLEDIGPSYARTLNIWRHRFMDKLEQVRALGYPEDFIRMWEFYLCYCEGGFIERSISDVHLLFSKSDNRRPQWIPSHV